MTHRQVFSQAVKAVRPGPLFFERPVVGWSPWSPVLAVKMLAEYLDHALEFERMAAREQNPETKAQLEKQAQAYRKLAIRRARELGMEPPEQ
jgi:hypothetical protein